MSQYVTLTMKRDMYDEIIDDLMIYCSNLNNYSSMEETVHLIDALEEKYQEDMVKQSMDFQQYQEYERLFEEHFKNNGGNLNDVQIDEYRNFHKINQVLEDYKEGEALDILDSKQQFCLVLDIINVMEEVMYR